jgi:hypothetical protein
MEAAEFPSFRDRPALQTWRIFIDFHLENWTEGEATADISSIGTPISPDAAWRPIKNLDRTAEPLPPGCYSLGHDPELICEHLQAQAALHTEAVNEAIAEWSRTWRRPRLQGEADFLFLLRLSFAMEIIHGLLAGEPLPVHLTRNRPDLADYPQSLKWLLITLWDALGNYFLQHFADDERARMRFKIDPSAAR